MGNNIHSKNDLNNDIHITQRNSIKNVVQPGNQDERMSTKNKIIFIASITVIAATQFYHLMKLIETFLK